MQLTGTEGGGGAGMELYHCGKNSGKTTWQKAALEVSDSGHPFPAPAPSPQPTCSILRTGT